jgi:hypothetical protein
VFIENYITCVSTELDAMIQVYNKHIIPRCIDQLNKNQQKGPTSLAKHFRQFETAFDELMQAKEQLDLWQENKVIDMKRAQEVREYIWEAGVRVDKVSRFLPRDQGWPEWDEFLFM